MGVIAIVNEIIEWVLDLIAKLKKWVLEQIRKAIEELKRWVIERILEIVTNMLVDVAEGMADGVEESEEIE